MCIPKILKNESNSQQGVVYLIFVCCCCVSQRYWKMKAIHNPRRITPNYIIVVVYPKDTEKWKQFTTWPDWIIESASLLCIPKILKNESNSQPADFYLEFYSGCCVSQRYWKMKAIHNQVILKKFATLVVVYPKDTEKWKQFTTFITLYLSKWKLLCIPKILKNESNSQLFRVHLIAFLCCCVSQRYWKMKAIHNNKMKTFISKYVVVYPKDTEKWKQFTTILLVYPGLYWLLCIPKILKNESNSQLEVIKEYYENGCCVSQRYWKMKAIHNRLKTLK